MTMTEAEQFYADPLAPTSAQFPLSRGAIASVRQIRLDNEGRPLIEMGPPTAPKTGSQDGSDGDPSEDYHND
jgi:hypothetical protein